MRVFGRLKFSVLFKYLSLGKKAKAGKQGKPSGGCLACFGPKKSGKAGKKRALEKKKLKQKAKKDEINKSAKSKNKQKGSKTRN